MKKRLAIYCHQTIMKKTDYEIMNMDQLSKVARSGEVFKRLFTYKSVRLYCDCLETLGQPFLIASVCRLLTLGECIFEDDEKNTIEVNIFTLIKMGIDFLKDQIRATRYLKNVETKIKRLESETIGMDMKEGSALFLRCDLPYYYLAGGSIGHIAAVVNNLELCTGYTPVMVSSREIPTVKSNIKKYKINSKVKYKNAGDLMSIAYNDNISNILDSVFANEKISFIYQRSALNAFAGIEYALKKKVPYVLEYNGSEIWIAKNWGNRDIKGLSLSEKIEMLTFKKANLITCVSKPLKDQLVDLGIDERKIIVTPNGVNPVMYHPNVNGDRIKGKYQIDKSKIVIGFIGTFGAWHGAEILAEAYVKLTYKYNNIHLLMIGDGMRMLEVKNIIRENKLEGVSTLTGIVPQKEGPEYLAACDILVSPTIRNPDGTPFFGSPTKLFEYMAMGKGIVASDLDQMSEILENEKTALLVEPNDVQAVADAIARLIEDSVLRLSLGENARKEVCKNYTWEMHTRKIVENLCMRKEI